MRFRLGLAAVVLGRRGSTCPRGLLARTIRGDRDGGPGGGRRAGSAAGAGARRAVHKPWDVGPWEAAPGPDSRSRTTGNGRTFSPRVAFEPTDDRTTPERCRRAAITDIEGSGGHGAERTTWTPSFSSRSRSQGTCARAHAVSAARSRNSCIST